MRQNTKYNLKNIFGSTISNQCAIDAARTLPWWSSLIVLLLGVLLPIIPLVVVVANTHGSNYISNLNYGLDRDLTSLTVKLHNEKKEFKVDDQKMLHYYDNGTEQLPNTEQDLTPIATYTNTSENQYELNIFYTRREVGDTPNLDDIYNHARGLKYVKGTITPKTDTDKDEDCYIPSFIIFHSKGIITALFKHNSITAVSSYSGDWACTESNKDLITRMLTVPGQEIPTEVKSLEYINGVFTNYKALYDECYITSINRMYLLNTTVYFGVYLGLVLLLGLLIFALTRGKNNPNRYLKWYQCQFIMYWSCFAPGLLAMVFGFLLAQYAMMFFIVFMGLRAMWMSMRQLSANYQTAA
ncbi:MAG: hypothetical protein E7181_01460 [Erysipelotrichaceae bacterium]|nr:hypothetical protein [Erysipelotrichaceae bacterium]